MNEESPPVKVHVTGSDVGGSITSKTRLITKYDTIKVLSANSGGPIPILPESDKRVLAEIIPHTPNAADGHTSNGWIGPTRGIVSGQQGTYIVAGGQGPTYILGSEALFCASDPASTTDLWLSLTITERADS